MGKTFTHTGLIKQLIGSIHPVGESHIDTQRLENLKDMCELVGNLLHEIEAVTIHKDAHEYSRKQTGEYADKFLKSLTPGE